jgi:hypothetical protein
MSTSQALAYQINDTLSAYIVVHDAIFAFSLRKILPIPGLFEPIDYCAHEQTLRSLSMRLNHITGMNFLDVRPTSEAEKEFLAILLNYALALQDTTNRLANISANLCRKSVGKSGYRYPDYRTDVSEYDASVKKYSALGGQLNALYNAI